MKQILRPKTLSEFPPYLPAGLAQKGRIVRLGRGDYLFRRGEAVEWLGYLLEGELKAVRLQPDGAQCVMIRCASGEFFAESSLATERYSCDGIAVCDSRVLLLPAAEVRNALRTEGDFAVGFAMAVARQARKQCSRYERVRLKRARDRVLHYLACESAPDGTLALAASLADFASELALEPETLYRTLAELESEGLLRRKNRKLELVRRENSGSARS